MRIENMEIEFRFSLPTTHPDGNGVIYSKECVDKIRNTKTPVPIKMIGRGYGEIVIGIAETIECDNYNTIICKGHLWAGGTEEFVELNGYKTVTSCEITSIGICADV